METSKKKSKPRKSNGTENQTRFSSQDQAKNTNSNEQKTISLELPESLKNFTKSTSRIVQQAASILEEELAIGIVAAKEFEERFVNVKELRSKDKADVMQRLRRDAHDVIDMLVDLVNATADSVGKLAEGSVNLGQADQSAQKQSAMNTPSLHIQGEIKSGESGTIEMALENESEEVSGSIHFFASDLVSTSGSRIVSTNVHFEPPSVVIQPGKIGKILIRVKVPPGIPPGMYSGLIQSTDFQQLKAIIVVNVAK